MSDLMPTVPSWGDISLRLILTFVCASFIGINRQAGGHAAGFRTTVLVALAACLAMIQANLLLSVTGKTEQSFAVMDTLRFPLGVLTGVGFIGGGAILKRGDFVRGVTTAATLWIVTAIGLCLGGGQWIVGCAGAAFAFIVLSPLKLLDEWLPQRRKARAVIASKTGRLPDLAAVLQAVSCDCRFMQKYKSNENGSVHFIYEIKWKSAGDSGEERIISAIEKSYQLERFEILDPTA